MNLVDILIPKVTPTKLLENIEQKNLKLYESVMHAAQYNEMNYAISLIEGEMGRKLSSKERVLVEKGVMQKLKKFGKGLALAGALSTAATAMDPSNVHPNIWHDGSGEQQHVTIKQASETEGQAGHSIHYPEHDDGLHLKGLASFDDEGNYVTKHAIKGPDGLKGYHGVVPAEDVKQIHGMVPGMSRATFSGADQSPENLSKFFTFLDAHAKTDAQEKFAAQDSIPGFMKDIGDHFGDIAQKYDLDTKGVLKHAFKATPHMAAPNVAGD